MVVLRFFGDRIESRFSRPSAELDGVVEFDTGVLLMRGDRAYFHRQNSRLFLGERI
jgi:hypothetical protein